MLVKQPLKARTHNILQATEHTTHTCLLGMCSEGPWSWDVKCELLLLLLLLVTHAAHAESAIKLIKNGLERAKKRFPNQDILTLLHKIQTAYNNAEHSTIFQQNCKKIQCLGLFCAVGQNILKVSSHWQIAAETIYAAKSEQTTATEFCNCFAICNQSSCIPGHLKVILEQGSFATSATKAQQALLESWVHSQN